MADEPEYNADGWMQNIVEMVDDLSHAETADDSDAIEACENRIRETPLSVSVRGGWHAVGDDTNGPEEYEILLCTGGPAARIGGEVGEHGEPESAYLEHQDWFKPWTRRDDLTKEQQEALLTFAQSFYYGE